jgi:hypothetical protein
MAENISRICFSAPDSLKVALQVEVALRQAKQHELIAELLAEHPDIQRHMREYSEARKNVTG